jgi:hypothetical protein
MLEIRAFPEIRLRSRVTPARGNLRTVMSSRERPRNSLSRRQIAINAPTKTMAIDSAVEIRRR